MRELWKSNFFTKKNVLYNILDYLGLAPSLHTHFCSYNYLSNSVKSPKKFTSPKYYYNHKETLALQRQYTKRKNTVKSGRGSHLQGEAVPRRDVRHVTNVSKVGNYLPVALLCQ